MKALTSSHRGTAALEFGLPVLAVLAAFLFLAPHARAQEDARRKQQIVFAELQPRTVDDAPFQLTAKSTSGLPITFEVISGPAVLDGKTLKLTGAPGLVVIRAAQEGNTAFQPALQAERAFPVSRRASTPEFLTQPMGVRAPVGRLVVLGAAAAGEPTPTFQWRKEGVPITGATESRLTIPSVSPSDAGDYDVVASNPNGSVASRRARVSVGKRTQSISFQAPAGAVAGQPIMLSASTSSGLPVRFDVISGTASLNGPVMTSQGGTVVVQASQAGDATYDAATPVTQTFLVTVGPNGQNGSHVP
jgi:hypothetical protein